MSIQRKDLITDDAIKAPADLAENLDKAVESYLKLIEEGKKADKIFSANSKSVKETSDETEKLKKRQTELEKVEKQIKTAQERSNKEYIKKRAELKKLQKEQREMIDAEQELIGTEEKLLAANKRLRAERRLINQDTEEGVARVKEINEEIDANTEKLKGNTDQTSKNRFQVGGYSDDMRGLLEELINVNAQEGGVKSFFGSMVGGLKQATIASLKFIATPVGAVIAAIVAGIAAITAVINNNQAASDEFNKIWGSISSVLEEVFARVIKLASALIKFATGDWKGAVEDASSAFTNLADSIQKAWEEGRRLVEMQIALEEATIRATTATAKLEGEIRKLEIIADDTTRSFKEREDAAEAARVKQSELAKLNLDLARRELEIVNLQVEQEIRRGTINRELRQQQADAAAEYIRAQNEALAVDLENEKTRRELKQDRLERDLDILIDGFDNIKTINEKIIQDDRRVLSERQENLNRLTELSTNSYNKQIETIKQFTGVAFDSSKLLQEQDAVRLNAMIRGLGLSEIIEGRLLEIIRERRIVLSDLVELQKELYGDIESLNTVGSLELKFDKKQFKEDTQEGFEELEDLIEKRREKEDEDYKKRLEAEKNFQQTRKKIIGDALNSSIELYNTLLENRIQQYEIENEEFQNAKEKELEAAEGNEERQAAIQEQMAAKEEETRKKVNKQRRKQALVDKALSITQILINTAKGISRAFAEFSFPVGLGFSIALGAIGAAQAATVAAQPIPQFAKGTKYSPEGLAIVNDGGGQELMETPDGKMHMVNSDGAALTYLQRGTKIYTAKETQEMLSKSAINGLNFVNPIEKKDIYGESMLNEMRALNKNFRKQRGTVVNIMGDAKYSNIVKQDYA